MAPTRGRIVKQALVAATAAAACTLVALWPRPTDAEEIADIDRMGEYVDDGMKFGEIVVKGQLVADAHVPGGWALVRTLQNDSAEAQTCTLEERVLRTETMLDARVNPAPVAVIARTHVIALGPHEKRTIGVALPAPLGAQITAAARARASVAQAHARMMASGKWNEAVLDRTYFVFDVDYLKPLPPGATAAKNDTGTTRPARMPGPAPTPREALGDSL